MEPIIVTKHINKEFRSGTMHVQALKEVNINIYPGELTLLRGRSGSGKTTLLNLLSALDKPTSGEIWFDNRDICALTENKRDEVRRTRLGFVFQSVALISQMTAYENVEFNLRVTGFDKKQYKLRAEQCLNAVGLGKRMHHLPGELSGGEQQRVAIARAVSHKPVVVFADEPTAELDTAMGLQVMRLFREMAATEGMTVVITTHDPQMMELADHVYILDDGIVIGEERNKPMGEVLPK